jgi:hypothetical protein
MGALSLIFFNQKVLLRALSFLFSVPKAIGFGLATRPNAIRFDFQPHPPVLDLAEPPDIY